MRWLQLEEAGKIGGGVGQRKVGEERSIGGTVSLECCRRRQTAAHRVAVVSEHVFVVSEHMVKTIKKGQVAEAKPEPGFRVTAQ